MTPDFAGSGELVESNDLLNETLEGLLAIREWSTMRMAEKAEGDPVRAGASVMVSN